MNARQKILAIEPEGLRSLLDKIDGVLKEEKKKIQITSLGGVAILLNGYRSRATLDFDIAPTKNAQDFRRICQRFNVPVDIIAIASTVDLVHCKTFEKYKGQYLTVSTVSPEDLIKLKLERFYKQDPEDIYAIMDAIALPYEQFKGIVKEMLPYFIGNPKQLLLSALIVVEIKYADKAFAFEKEMLN